MAYWRVLEEGFDIFGSCWRGRADPFCFSLGRSKHGGPLNADPTNHTTVWAWFRQLPVVDLAKNENHYDSGPQIDDRGMDSTFSTWGFTFCIYLGFSCWNPHEPPQQASRFPLACWAHLGVCIFVWKLVSPWSPQQSWVLDR